MDTADDREWVNRRKTACDSTLRRIALLTEDDRDVVYARDDLSPVVAVTIVR